MFVVGVGHVSLLTGKKRANYLLKKPCHNNQPTSDKRLVTGWNNIRARLPDSESSSSSEQPSEKQSPKYSREKFTYIPGAQGKVDVWFIIGLFVFIVPIIAIWWGVSTGVIDLSPR